MPSLLGSREEGKAHLSAWGSGYPTVLAALRFAGGFNFGLGQASCVKDEFTLFRLISTRAGEPIIQADLEPSTFDDHAAQALGNCASDFLQAIFP